MKISFVRGAFLNNYEGQNYNLPHLTGYSSLFPVDAHVSFPLVRLPSIADIQNISFLRQPIKYVSNRTLGDSQILFGLEGYIKDSDIVHIGDPHYYYSYQAALMRKNKRIKKLLSTWWEIIPFNNESTWAKKTMKKFVMNLVDMFVCYSEKARGCLIAEGIPSERITVIALGVNTGVFHPTEKTENDSFTILFVGRLVEEKGILDAYESFKRLERRDERIHLRIVGEGPMKYTIESLMKKDGLSEKITFEHKTYQQMAAVYQSADVLCVPSKKTSTWEEQYGMVFIEAMASGVPILSYNTGVIKDVVGEAGIFITENDSRGLTSTLERLLIEKDLRRKIGTIGRERALALYDAKSTADKLMKMYTSL